MNNKKVPDCRLSVDPSKDFFLERFNKVDTEGWEPVLSMMHQFAEVFNFYDYVALGAKITRYVELVSLRVSFITKLKFIVLS